MSGQNRTERQFNFEINGSLLVMVLMALVGWLFTDRRFSPFKRSRSLEEMSPAYQRVRNENIALEHVGMYDVGEHIDRLVSELVQPHMTELEAKQAREYISKTARRAMNYKERRIEYLEDDSRLRSEQETDELQVLRI